MSVAQDSTEMVVRPKREIVVCRAPVQEGEHALIRQIARKMAERGINCFIQRDEHTISLVAA